MDWHLDRLLERPNMTVVKVQEIEGLIFLSLESLKEGIICPRCGNYTEDVHQTREVPVRDLSICGRGVYLKVPRRQFICSKCGRYTTEELEGMVFKRHHTERYEEYVYRRVVATTVKQVSREEQRCIQLSTLFTKLYTAAKTYVRLLKPEGSGKYLSKINYTFR